MQTSSIKTSSDPICPTVRRGPELLGVSTVGSRQGGPETSGLPCGTPNRSRSFGVAGFLAFGQSFGVRVDSLREVETGELAEVFKCSGVVGAGSGFFIVEESQINDPAVEFDLGHPIKGASDENNALESRLAPLEYASIALVFGMGRKSQIGPPVAEPVPVDVVYLGSVQSAKNKAMHSAGHPLSAYAHLGQGVRCFVVPEPEPPVTGNCRVVVCINKNPRSAREYDAQ